ncbi:hypothetical protein [Bacillus xiapuensis]|uniref:Uncharacterized protein n=1 Tax=Bacillus xiapuensis TaxID=2014075 RepID=A0ABU6NB84_9BACI|nr:hypothetical protein [Bacillus xiapuensis]
MRYEDIIESLDEVDEILLAIKEKYNEATQDKNIKEIVKPKIKSALVQLRSCLDYCIKDIDELVLNRKSKEVYFPYKNSKKKFQETIHFNFPRLRNINPNIYLILESVQDFNNKEYPWLTTMCRKTNFNKHNKHTNQQRGDGSEKSIPGVIKIRDLPGAPPNRNIIIKGSKVEVSPGVLASLNLKIDSNGEVVDYVSSHPKLSIERIDWVTFKIEGTDKDVLEFLTKSRIEIGKMIEKIYKEIQ